MSDDITRNEFLTRVAATGTALAVASSAQEQASGKPRPNFLVILSDDHMYRAIGYNNPVVKTPNLDRLAQDGLILDRAYIATPICAASRASLLTGVFPEQHGSIALDGSGFHKSVVQDGRYPTLAQRLQSAGYHTAFCGKSHLGPPRDYGFAEGEEGHDRTDAETFAFAGDFLRRRLAGDPPFLLWVAARQPHIPLQPDAQWVNLYKDAKIPIDPNFSESPPQGSEYNQGLPGEQYYRDSDARDGYKNLPAGPPRAREVIEEFTRAYYAVVSHLDHQIGELVATLKETGHYENTVIIYISDNGYFLGNHGLGNKITMHDESVRVPMCLHWPGMTTARSRSQSLVSSLDLYPTLLDLAGVTPPGYLEGKSLRPLFTDANAQLRDFAASECVGVGGKPGMGHRMVCTEQWKYVLTDTSEEALYDERNDPYELTNVAHAPEHRASLNRMRARMKEWMTRIGDTHQPPPQDA